MRLIVPFMQQLRAADYTELDKGYIHENEEEYSWQWDSPKGISPGRSPSSRTYSMESDRGNRPRDTWNENETSMMNIRVSSAPARDL